MSIASTIPNRLLYALLLSATCVSGCRARHEWHQELSIVVETPAGERKGASVVDVTALFGRVLLSGTEVEYEVRGEATVVEISPGRYLFALLGGSPERFPCAVGNAMGWNGPWTRGIDGLNRGQWLTKIPQQVGAPSVEVPKQCLPSMVTFGNINDPKTVQRVNPQELALAFGDGVTLKVVKIKITDEPVTMGILEEALGRRPNGNSLQTIWSELPRSAKLILDPTNWISE